MNAHAPRCQPPARQAGFSLITAMILLVIAVLLGITASQIVLMSERSARYERDRQIAFQAAESALLDAEFDLRGPGSIRSDMFSPTASLGFVAGCGRDNTSRGLCLPAGAGEPPVWTAVSFTDTSNDAPTVRFGTYTNRAYAAGSRGVQPALLPRYLIEVLADPTPGINADSPRYLYRVTAVGFGPRLETQVMLQMYFRKE